MIDWKLGTGKKRKEGKENERDRETERGKKKQKVTDGEKSSLPRRRQQTAYYILLGTATAAATLLQHTCDFSPTLTILKRLEVTMRKSKRELSNVDATC